jgi:hypothetical protein
MDLSLNNFSLQESIRIAEALKVTHFFLILGKPDFVGFSLFRKLWKTRFANVFANKPGGSGHHSKFSLHFKNSRRLEIRKKRKVQGHHPT